jgi:cytoskeletal protein CcmA (bactofilin family)
MLAKIGRRRADAPAAGEARPPGGPPAPSRDPAPRDAGAPTVPLPSPLGRSAAADGRVPTILAAGLRGTGTVESDGDVHIDGRFVGDVACASLTIGRDGSLQGDVRAEAVRIHGAFEGRIVAAEVQAMEGARVRGRVFQRALEVRKGAEFVCDVRPYEDADAEERAGSPRTRDVTARPNGAAHPRRPDPPHAEGPAAPAD